MSDNEFKHICEVLIFASDVPLKIQRIVEITERPEELIRKTVDELIGEYQESGRTFKIIPVAGGYQFVSKARYSEWVRRLSQSRKKTRLSQSALEALSIIAYKQPIGRTEVETIRGVDSSGVLKTLLERNLIDIKSRGKGPGRPNLYRTTDEFLRYFGLEDLEDLPKLKEVEDILTPDTYEVKQIPGDNGNSIAKEE